MSISVHLNVAHTTQNNLSKRSWARSLSSQERQNDNAMVPLVRIGKGDRSLPVLSLSFKFQLVWLLMFCFRLHNSSKSIISGFTTFHHRDSTRYNFWKQINLQKAVKHNKRKKLISSINTSYNFEVNNIIMQRILMLFPKGH